MKTEKEQAKDRVEDLREEISLAEYWLTETSNPMKIRRRNKAIKKAKSEIKELRAKFNF